MPPTRFTELDVRPLLDSGVEPLTAILAAVDQITPDQGLLVIAPFPPAPLLKMLQSQGLNGSMEMAPDGSWHASFWRE